jgi:acetoin utilization deacetylase AcuC-like enzyme
MKVYRPHMATQAELLAFHSPEYVDFLKRVTPTTVHMWSSMLNRFNINEDTPIFNGLYPYCQMYTGGSLDG